MGTAEFTPSQIDSFLKILELNTVRKLRRNRPPQRKTTPHVPTGKPRDQEGSDLRVPLILIPRDDIFETRRNQNSTIRGNVTIASTSETRDASMSRSGGVDDRHSGRGAEQALKWGDDATVGYNGPRGLQRSDSGKGGQGEPKGGPQGNWRSQFCLWRLEGPPLRFQLHLASIQKIAMSWCPQTAMRRCRTR